ncbi:MAG: phytanoyl-CoA dioxygenase family protein, partial [Pseudomonadota bacterium]
MTELKHLPANAKPKAIAAAVQADGACIIDDLLAADQLAALNDELAPFIAATEHGRDDFTGRKTRRTGALAARSSLTRDLILHPSITGACDRFLKPFCDRYQLHLTQTIAIGPGQGEQPLHRDRLAWGGYLQREIEPQL